MTNIENQLQCTSEFVKSVQSTLNHLITTSVKLAMFTQFLVKNTIYIEWIYLGVELHNLMNMSNPLNFKAERFQLSLSMKSQLNVNSSGPKRFDSERKIMFYKTFICFYVSEAKPLCFSLCSRMFDDVERC